MHNIEDFEVIRLEPNQPVEIDGTIIEMRPTKLYILPQGSKSNKPSYAFLMEHPHKSFKVLAQISEEMFFEALERNRCRYCLTGDSSCRCWDDE